MDDSSAFSLHDLLHDLPSTMQQPSGANASDANASGANASDANAFGANEYPPRECSSSHTDSTMPGQGPPDLTHSTVDDTSRGKGPMRGKVGGGSCDTCGASLVDHKPAKQVLAELPLDTITKLWRHQFHKDVRRITFAHAEQYVRMLEAPPSETPRFTWISTGSTLYKYRLHSRQKAMLRSDLERHRGKYASYYHDAWISHWRWQDTAGTSHQNPFLPNPTTKTMNRAEEIKNILIENYHFQYAGFAF
ncbi:hypothetical protein F4810DRAFT_698480 [Camillea tinctor]|nr:hypothetical protein F4810DRAFT_698480 [Camillea tinctor]